MRGKRRGGSSPAGERAPKAVQFAGRCAAEGMCGGPSRALHGLPPMQRARNEEGLTSFIVCYIDFLLLGWRLEGLAAGLLVRVPLAHRAVRGVWYVEAARVLKQASLERCGFRSRPEKFFRLRLLPRSRSPFFEDAGQIV